LKELAPPVSDKMVIVTTPPWTLLSCIARFGAPTTEMGGFDALKRHSATHLQVDGRATGIPSPTPQRASIKCAGRYMTGQPIDSAGPVRDVHKRRLTRVALATTIGTAIEAFDFLAFGTAAALVFNTLFFPRFESTAAAVRALWRPDWTQEDAGVESCRHGRRHRPHRAPSDLWDDRPLGGPPPHHGADRTGKETSGEGRE
jgi:hypothetical protein